MRPNRIRLVDLGMGSRFSRSFEHLSSTIESINAGYLDPELPEHEQSPVAEVELVRSRSEALIDQALASQALVVHLTSHGDISPDEGLVLFSDDEHSEYKLSDLPEWLQGWGTPITASGLILDACKTNTGIARGHLRQCITTPMTYVGTTRAVGWHDGAVWASGFYGALLRRKGAGLDPGERIVDACDRANQAFKLITGTKSPYRCDVLEPTQKTIKAFEE